jgi:hypothetical protein
MSGGWTRDELLASVEPHTEMQRKVRAEEQFAKKRLYEELSVKFNRTDKAFE